MTDAQVAFEIPTAVTAEEVLDRIRRESRDESEKGRWFEQLFMRVAQQNPEFEIEEIWRWPDWPQREELTGPDGRDFGIDLVARRTGGEWIAIQCKCYDDRATLPKSEIDKFLGGSQHEIFSLRWVVATCRWSPNAERAIQNANPQVRQIDFHRFTHIQIEEEHAERPVQNPWPLQEEAIEDVVEGLTNHDRGRLIMACGTGKTFTSLRIAENLIPQGGGGACLRPHPSRWSPKRGANGCVRRHGPLSCIVVCSDRTAGGRNETEDIGTHELECPVTTDPGEIANFLKGGGNTRVVFCTYHSLSRVTEAQESHDAPSFDLAIADEAHRTTGALTESRGPRSKVNFQEFHDARRLHARKRLYMTATPRIYTERSKRKLAQKGIGVVDMDDQYIYGPELHRLPFGKAVNHRMLSDYRVIVLGVNAASVTRGLRKRLEDLDTPRTRKQVPSISDMTRVLGVSLAVNGITEGEALDQPSRLPRTMAFANSILRSKWYASALKEPQVLRATTRQMQDGRAMKMVTRHLDASASALTRNLELRALAQADREGECRVICNVKLFTEGVDVPRLDAVAFLDPRDSQVDVVQAVGRVMRKAEGKRFGYIIVPVVVERGDDVVAALERGTEGYRTVGRVLRALQAHDGRLVEDPATFIKVYEQERESAPGESDGGVVSDPDTDELQRELRLREAEQGIYAHVAAASGLGKPGQIIADDIADVVKRASTVFQDEALEGPLAEVLGLVPEEDGGAKGICTIAALMLCNACLLQRRLRDEPHMTTVIRLDKVAGAKHPKEVLDVAWSAILEKDYAPVFRPALVVLGMLHESEAVENAIRALAERANRVADSLSELGYDHAGPLYHRILGSAKSDGAFYTNNISAIMLAQLALTQDMMDWSDAEAVGKLRIMDPACGTGTLLMAALQTIKARVRESTKIQNLRGGGVNVLHKRLVEDVLCGLDINQHAIQLAACNMTLGAPTVDYERMNLVTMPHGPQRDGFPKAGSLEILTAAEDAQEDLQAMFAPSKSLKNLDAAQINESKRINFPLHDLDAVIMNAPFTANDNRSKKYGEFGRKLMQRRERDIKKYLANKDGLAGDVVNANSIATFFTPLADMLLNGKKGTLAKVIPTTGCTNSSSLAARRFLADRFHIETIVTSHDPKRMNFSENTNIHESLLVCRRRANAEERPTRFISLRVMPETVEEVIEVVGAIQANDTGEWFTTIEQPEILVRAGDWRPCQFLDAELVSAAMQLERDKNLVQLATRHPLGPSGRGIRGVFSEDETGDYHVFWGRSKDLRTSMEAIPEKTVRTRDSNSANRYRSQAGYVLLASIFDTKSGRLLAIFSEEPGLGSMWVPVQAQSTGKEEAKALCAWFNSTLGALGFLMFRTKKLTNPSFSQDALARLQVPDFQRLDIALLLEAYERTKNVEVQSWKYAADDRFSGYLGPSCRKDNRH